MSSHISKNLLLGNFGQSNSTSTQAEAVARLMDAWLLGHTFNSFGGTAISQWISGTDPGPYSRNTQYESDFYKGDGTAAMEILLAANPNATGIVISWFQGEQDAVNETTEAEYTGKLQFLKTSLASDLGLPVILVSGLIHSSDATGLVAIRAALTAASDAVYETNDLARAVGPPDVHLTSLSRGIASRRAFKKILPLIEA